MGTSTCCDGCGPGGNVPRVVITVVGLNTALDHTLDVPLLRSGGVSIARASYTHAGGKGLNVARVLRRLGEEVTLIGFLGGAPATAIDAACGALAINAHWVRISGETRTCTIVVDRASGEQTVVNEPGPTVSLNDITRAREAIHAAVTPGDLLCIAGSTPPGVPDEFYAGLVTELHARNVRTLLDIRGPSLVAALRAHPWAIAPNLEEAGGVVGASVIPVEAARVLAAHAAHVFLTLGADGVLVAREGTVIRLLPPHIEAVNAVGSGDAFVAGFLAGTARGMTVVDSARLGVACGASNAARLEPDIGCALEIRGLLDAVQVTEIEATV